MEVKIKNEKKEEEEDIAMIRRLEEVDLMELAFENETWKQRLGSTLLMRDGVAFWEKGNANCGMDNKFGEHYGWCRFVRRINELSSPLILWQFEQTFVILQIDLSLVESENGRIRIWRHELPWTDTVHQNLEVVKFRVQVEILQRRFIADAEMPRLECVSEWNYCQLEGEPLKERDAPNERPLIEFKFLFF